MNIKILVPSLLNISLVTSQKEPNIPDTSKMCDIKYVPRSEFCKQKAENAFLKMDQNSNICLDQLILEIKDISNMKPCLMSATDKASQYFHDQTKSERDNICKNWHKSLLAETDANVIEKSTICYDQACVSSHKDSNFMVWLGSKDFECAIDFLVILSECNEKLSKCQSPDSRLLSTAEDCKEIALDCSIENEHLQKNKCKDFGNHPDPKPIPQPNQSTSNHSKEKIAASVGVVALVVLCAMAAKKKLSSTVSHGFHPLQLEDIEMTRVVNPAQDMRLAS